MISNFHEKMDNMKVVLQFAQKIDIIKKPRIVLPIRGFSCYRKGRRQRESGSHRVNVSQEKTKKHEIGSFFAYLELFFYR